MTQPPRSIPACAAAALSAAALVGCAPVVHDADFVRASPIQTAGAGVSRADSAYANAVQAIDRRDYARALELLQMARQYEPGDVRVLNAMGVIYDKLGRFDLSRRYYAQAAKADPSSPIVQANIAYSQRLQDGAAGRTELAATPIVKVSPPAIVAASASRTAAPPPAAPTPAPVVQPAGPSARVEHVAAVTPRNVAGLSQPSAARIRYAEAAPTPAAVREQPAPMAIATVQPAAAPAQVERVAAVKARKVPGLSQPTAARISYAEPAPEPRPQPAPVALAAFRPTAAPAQVERVAAVKARRVPDLSQPPAARISYAEAAPAPRPQPVPVAMAAVQPAAAPARVERVAAVKPRSVAGLSRLVAPRIAATPPTDPAAASPAPARLEPAPRLATLEPVQAVAISAPKRVVISEPAAPAAQVRAPATAAPRPQAVALVSRAVPRIDVPAEPRLRAAPTAAVRPQPVQRAAIAPAPARRASPPVPRSVALASAQGGPLRVATPKLRPAPAARPTMLASARPALRIVNASGHLYRAETVRASLAGLGWSAPRWAMGETRVQQRTVIYYAPSRLAVAKALANTLPGSARLTVCANCAGLQLVIGADARAWKPMPRPVVRAPRRTRTA